VVGFQWLCSRGGQVLRCGALLLLGSHNTLEVNTSKTNSAGARNSLHMRSYRARIPWQPSQTAAGSCMRRASPCHATINIKLPFRAVDDIACRRSSSPRFTATSLSHLLLKAPCAAKQQFYSMHYTDRINALFGSCFCATRPPFGYACRATKALVLECPCDLQAYRADKPRGGHFVSVGVGSRGWLSDRESNSR
jgi:hypothetical protein